MIGKTIKKVHTEKKYAGFSGQKYWKITLQRVQDWFWKLTRAVDKLIIFSVPIGWTDSNRRFVKNKRNAVFGMY